MAAAPTFHLQVSAAQVGKYFLGKYYNVLQHQPDYLQHFYTSSSTMLRTDGTARFTASSLPQIHDLVMSLHYTKVEIKTAHSLESWNGGILVMVTGLVHLKNFKRKFVETFFLSPQDKGYFVLNNIFHSIDDEQSDPYLSQIYEDDETRVWDCVSPTRSVENGPAGKYNFTEQQLQQIYKAKKILENSYSQFNGSMTDLSEIDPSPAEENTGKLEKHTYASIIAKTQYTTPASTQTSPRKSRPAGSRSTPQQSVPSSSAIRKYGYGAGVELSKIEGEMKSVYAKNLPSTVTPFQIEEVFKKFGRLKSNGVFIKHLEDIGVCYGFVEFEDVSGVQNALKASKVQIAGREVYIEERRLDGVIKYRGRGKGRGNKRHSKGASFGGQGFGRGKSFYRVISQ